jgi:hypothetical protein
LFLASTVICGQEMPDAFGDSVLKNIIDQVLLYPQEKIYIHTDKSSYLSGERIWFRAYLADAILHRPLSNRHLIVELINPVDSVVQRVMIKMNRGACSGFIQLGEKTPEGDYTICGYTGYMKNPGNDLFFKRSIHISIPPQAAMDISAEFRFETQEWVTAAITFRKPETGEKVKPEELRIGINDEAPGMVRIGKDKVAYFTFRLPEKAKRRYIYVSTRSCGKYFLVPWTPDDYEVTFYPEGGGMPEGVESRIAFKALNSDGLPEMITGRIIDSDSIYCGDIKSVHDGMGAFLLNPYEGKRYFALCRNGQGKEKQFELPVPVKGIISLKAEKVKDHLFISLLSSGVKKQRTPLYLVVHTRGIVHYASKLDTVFDGIFFEYRKIAFRSNADNSF